VPEPDENPQPRTPSAGRLVIRVNLTPKGPPEAPVRRRLSRDALLLILGAVAVLGSWVGISMFRTEPTAAPAATEAARNPTSQPSAPVPAPSAAAPAVSNEPIPKADAPPSAINQVIPDVSRSAQQTIRGTIVVSVRVTVGKEGTVLGATPVIRGPSRYFERLAVEAAKKWTFTPAVREEPRIMLVSFSFKRTGTTARASPQK
jgi:TonB family protein